MQRNRKRQLSYTHFSLSTTFIPHVLMYILNAKKNQRQQFIYLMKYKEKQALSHLNHLSVKEIGFLCFALCSALLSLHPSEHSCHRVYPQGAMVYMGDIDKPGPALKCYIHTVWQRPKQNYQHRA